LAAARVKTLSLEQLAARLDDKLTLLTTGSRTAQPRQQTLRATINWSYELLSEAEQIALPRLSILAGNWTLEAAESVAMLNELAPRETLDLITPLLDKSL
jgi:predicted ATPase